MTTNKTQSSCTCTCTCGAKHTPAIPKALPTAKEPQTVKGKHCYNCKQAPLYYFDTTWGEECDSDCSKESPCEQCQEDRDFPHVVKHECSLCCHKVVIHHKSKKEALAMWDRQNVPRHLRSK